MIPETLLTLIKKQSGDFHRADENLAILALESLKIPLTSEFAEFYIKYCPIDFKSTVSDEYIMDICEPSEQVLAGTQFIHEVWELPTNFICFTSLQGEGGYLLDIEAGSVFDFDLADWDDFTAKKIPARWRTFYEFMTWFLT